MSIFGTTQKPSSQEEVTAPVFEGYSAEVNGDIIAFQESWEDQALVVEALHELDIAELELRGDLKTLKENGASADEIAAREADYEAVTEAMVGNAWAKIKAFFSKLWGKIKAFFKSVISVFDQIFKSSENFIKKYESDLKKKDLTGFKYKMLTYTNIDAAKFMDLDVKAETNQILTSALKVATSANTDAEIEKLGQEVTKLRESKDETLDKYRGEVVGGGSLSSNQFEEHLYGLFRNNAKGKDDATEQAVRITDIIAAVKNTDGKKKAEEFAKKTDEEFTKIIKAVADMEKALGSKDASHHDNYTPARNAKVVDALRAYSTQFSAQKDIQLAVFRAWKTAYTERNATFKAVAGAALRYTPKK